MNYVLIIGANSDMAKALARVYANNGFDIILASRNEQAMKSFAKDLMIRFECDVQVYQFDVLEYDTHLSFYESLKLPLVGVIVAVGYLGQQTLAEKDFTESAMTINTNFTGIISILNIFAADFEQRKMGFIVVLSSVAGERGRQKNYIYGAAKAGLTAYLSGLRNRLHQSNVPVLTVKPGFVTTKMTQHLDLPDHLTAHPKEIAQAIYHAQKKCRDILYYPRKWRLIMVVIRSLPERIFKRLDL